MNLSVFLPVTPVTTVSCNKPIVWQQCIASVCGNVMTDGARYAGLSISITEYFLGFLHTTDSTIYLTVLWSGMFG